MKRIISILLAMLMLVSSAAFAEVGAASQLGDDVVFEQAIKALQHYNQPESVAQAVSIFESITSNYNSASLFKGYAAAFAFIHAGDINGAEMYIQVLTNRSEFDALLQNYGLPSVNELETYIKARRAEESGNSAAIEFDSAQETEISACGQSNSCCEQICSRSDIETDTKYINNTDTQTDNVGKPHTPAASAAVAADLPSIEERIINIKPPIRKQIGVKSRSKSVMDKDFIF